MYGIPVNTAANYSDAIIVENQTGFLIFLFGSSTVVHVVPTVRIHTLKDSDCNMCSPFVLRI